jgi:hypothetical protein
MQKKSKKGSKSKKKNTGMDPKLRIWLGAGAALLVLFGLVIPLSAMQLENHNSFCASCHTQGEQTFFDRSTAKDPVDLASVHDIKGQARCIDCHTGPGIIGRYGGLMAGSTDLISFFSGHYPQPAALEEPYPDENCMKCHQAIATKKDFNNHFHVFLFQWQAKDPTNAAHCVDCHASHDTTNDAGAAFLNKNATVQVCQKCHASAGAG